MADKATGKRPADAEPSADKRSKVGSADFQPASWMGKAGDGGAANAGPSASDLLRKAEQKKAVSSIASKLSAPRVKTTSAEDSRKQKVGSFSAGLTKEQILESQQRSGAFVAKSAQCSSAACAKADAPCPARRHREKCEAKGQPVPYYRSNH